MKKKEIIECLFEVMKLELQNNVVCQGESIAIELLDGTNAKITIKECN